MGIYDLDWLLNKSKTTDEKMYYILFWHAERGNVIGKGCFSQWQYSPFVDENNVKYLYTEQYMMAKKAELFGDNETLQKIMLSTNPREMKALGREVKNFKPEVWDAECRKIVTKGNYFKFTQDPNLKKLLLDTKDAILVEASPFDAIWGIKMAETDINATNPLKWEGKNYLGFCLMTVRDILNGKQKLEDIM